MSNQPDESIHNRLLPKGWLTAPKSYYLRDVYGAYTFLWTNLLLGTLGLWAPIIGAALTGKKPVPQLLNEMMASGSIYLFVIPFIASISASVFTAAHSAENSSAFPLKRNDFLKSVILLIFIACSFLLPYQLFADGKVMTLNFAVQAVVCVLATVTGVYVHCLLQLDITESVPEDIDRRANMLSDGARNAHPNRGDFE